MSYNRNGAHGGGGAHYNHHLGNNYHNNGPPPHQGNGPPHYGQYNNGRQYDRYPDQHTEDGYGRNRPIYFPNPPHSRKRKRETQSIPVSKPVEIACMSRTDARAWESGSRAGLPVYHPPPLPSDLNQGFDTFMRDHVSETPESLANVLRAVRHARQQQGNATNPAPHFVTWRGNLTKIMCHPYSQNDEFLFGVWKINQTIYISTRATQSKLSMDANMDARGKRFMYYGYKFEECCTRTQDPPRGGAPSGEDGNVIPQDLLADSGGESPSPPLGQHIPNLSPDATEDEPREPAEAPATPSPAASAEGPVNTNVCFGSVFKTTIAGHKIVAGGEVDCEEPAGGAPGSLQSPNERYVELKVTKLLKEPRDVRSFEKYKLLKWYCQSFLAGVPKIVVGFRDQDGQLRKIQALETVKIPKMIKGREEQLWDSKVCLHFLADVLGWLKYSVQPGEMYTLSYGGRGSAVVLTPGAVRQDDEQIDEELYL